MTTPLPLFYFKPTVCWVDDDQIFLDAVSISLENYYHCLTFNSPKVGIEFFKNYQSPLSNSNFKHELKESDLFGTNNHHPVDLNILNIKDLAIIPEKFREIAVLVVDYSMPGMNGLELCQQLKSLPMKKILLTGDATYEKTIEAFNMGLIDKFIRKDHNITEKLQKYINELIYFYFYEKTTHLISHLETSKPSLLSDFHFVNFFNTWRRENHVEEFYLINRQGSFLVKDNNGKYACFIIMSEFDIIRRKNGSIFWYWTRILEC
jgi:CheY-like chemotaxis protein